MKTAANANAVFAVKKSARREAAARFSGCKAVIKCRGRMRNTAAATNMATNTAMPNIRSGMSKALFQNS